MAALKTQFDLDLERIILMGLQEDVGSGDHSSLACIPSYNTGAAKLLVKERGVIAGVDFAKKLCETVDSNLKVDVLIADGTPVSVGDVVFIVKGPSLSLLKVERLMLNTMQRYLFGKLTNIRKAPFLFFNFWAIEVIIRL